MRPRRCSQAPRLGNMFGCVLFGLVLTSDTSNAQGSKIDQSTFNALAAAFKGAGAEIEEGSVPEDLLQLLPGANKLKKLAIQDKEGDSEKEHESEEPDSQPVPKKGKTTMAVLADKAT